MGISKNELLALLTTEYEAYSLIPASEPQQKRDKKCFINGMMTACRVVGISFEELSAIIATMPQQPKRTDSDAQLSIPAYIRNNVQLKC